MLWEKKRWFVLFSLLALLCIPNALVRAASRPTGTVTIILNPVFNGQPIAPGLGHYVNAHGDTLSVDVFKFYLTNIGVSTAAQGSGGLSLPRNSHLFDLDDTTTWRIDVPALPGNFELLHFNIGVDSIDNKNGANGGDLDPAKGMYWAWNSGYVMAKLEGKSPVCNTLHQEYGFHIGGYQAPYNAVRFLSFALPSGTSVQADGHLLITLQVDVAAWFSNGLDLRTTNSILTPGKDACGMADRYATMFSVISITK